MVHWSIRWSRSLLLIVLTAACGGGSSSPTAPGSTSGPAIDPSCPASSAPPTCGAANSLAVEIGVGGSSGPWTYSIGTLTVSGSGPQFDRIIGITPGTVAVSGQLQTSNLLFQIGIPETNAGGSIPPGSVQNVAGPATAVGTCTIQYSMSGNTSVAFQFQFTLNAAGSATSCRS